jgi:four helix bundle protein
MDTRETGGAQLAIPTGMPLQRIEDLVAFQFAGEFKLAVYDLIERHPDVKRSFKYRDQLDDAASGIERAVAEGFGRNHPGEFVQFLRYALGSLAEATTCIRDGIHRQFFTESDCEVAFTWGRRCKGALLNLQASQRRRATRRRAFERNRKPRRREAGSKPRNQMG